MNRNSVLVRSVHKTELCPKYFNIWDKNLILIMNWRAKLPS